MKLVIEISDKELMEAVNQQMGKVIAETVTDNIKGEMDKILAIKFERLTDRVIDEAMQRKISDLIGATSDVRAQKIHWALVQTAEKLLKEHLK
jgi:hypothetical protein